MQPEPFHRDLRRVNEKGKRPPEYPRQRRQQRDTYREGESARAPDAKHPVRTEHHRQGQCTGCRPFGEKSNADSRSHQQSGDDGLAADPRQAVDHQRGCGNDRRFSGHHVRGNQKPERTDENERRYPPESRPKQFCARHGGEQYGKRHVEPTGQARAVVQRHEGRKNLAEECRRPVIQRRLIEIRLTRQHGDQPVATLQHAIYHAEGLCLLRFPRVMSNQPRQQPTQHDQQKQRRFGGRCGPVKFQRERKGFRLVSRQVGQMRVLPICRRKRSRLS